MKGNGLTGVSIFRQEGGRRLAIEMGFNRFQNKFKGRSALECASGYDCPQPLVRLAAIDASSTLCYVAVYYDKTDSLLCSVIGWPHAGGGGVIKVK